MSNADPHIYLNLPISCFQGGFPLWEEVAEFLWALGEEKEWAPLLLPSQRGLIPAAQRGWSSLWDPAASYKIIAQMHSKL